MNQIQKNLDPQCKKLSADTKNKKIAVIFKNITVEELQVMMKALEEYRNARLKVGILKS